MQEYIAPTPLFMLSYIIMESDSVQILRANIYLIWLLSQ